jgi:hypothetical protein
VFFVFFVDAAKPAGADAPVAAGAAVRRIMEAYRSNDRATFLDAVADDYDYDGLKKTDLDPFGALNILYDHLLYRVLEVLAVAPGVVTALVDADFTGRANLDALGNGRPGVAGIFRIWVEVRQQRDGQWRVSAIRPVRLRYTHADTPMTLVEGVSVNGLSSLIVPPGTALTATGQTEFGAVQDSFIGPISKLMNLHLNLNINAFEPWVEELPAPNQPGRYYLNTVSFVSAHLPDGRFFLSWDEASVPVVVK